MKFEKLTELQQIGPKKRKSLCLQWAEEFYGADFVYKKALREWDDYDKGENPHYPVERSLLEHITENPYHLTDFAGIGFAIADDIALQNFNVSRDDKNRHKYGNMFITKKSQGVTNLADYRAERTKLGLDLANWELEGVFKDDFRVWHPEEIASENWLAQWYVDNTVNPRGFEVDKLSQVFDYFEKTTLNTKQKDSILAGLTNRVSIITGDAGTGKSYTMSNFVKICLDIVGLNVAMCALAGAAVSVFDDMLRDFDIETAEIELKDKLGNDLPDRFVECATIHRTLGYNGHSYIIDELRGVDVLIIDEAWMLNNKLLSDLLKRVSDRVRIIMLGDGAQLGPIGYGRPLASFFSLGGFTHTHLIENYRQAGEQELFELCKSIRGGVSPASVYHFNSEKNVTIDFGTKDLRPAFGKAFMSEDLLDWQVLSATNISRERLNKYLQENMNPDNLASNSFYRVINSRLSDKEPDGVYDFSDICLSDKIIVTKNKSALDVYNGQIGTVTGRAQLSPEDEGVTDLNPFGRPTTASEENINFDIKGREIEMPLDDAQSIVDLAYVITGHKSQGSGWNTVITYQDAPVRGDSRAWWYTVISRAKKNIHIFTDLTEKAFWANALREPPEYGATLTERIEKLLGGAVVMEGNGAQPQVQHSQI